MEDIHKLAAEARARSREKRRKYRVGIESMLMLTALSTTVSVLFQNMCGTIFGCTLIIAQVLLKINSNLYNPENDL